MADAHANTLSDQDRRTLLAVATDSIVHFLGYAEPMMVNPAAYAPALRVERATFVTLQLNHALRGCIGTLEARRPLIQDVAFNAAAAGFQDPRFPPVTFAEAPLLDIHISILSPSEPMSFTSQEDLISQMRPGVDGLILQDNGRRGTFLPAVWETLPDARRFLEHLKLKAGLPAHHWSDTLRVWRYTAESVP